MDAAAKVLVYDPTSGVAEIKRMSGHVMELQAPVKFSMNP